MPAPAVAMSSFARTVYEMKYQQGEEEWPDTARRVVENVVKPYFPDKVEPLVDAISRRKFLPGGRYLYATGKRNHQVNNCLLLSVDDSREGWASLMGRVTAGLMTGAGIGVVYSKLRSKGSPVRGMGGESTGPISLMEMVNEAGRHIMQGGSRRAAIWAGLHWNHPDILEFIHVKDWSEDVKRLKDKDFNFPARMDNTNISVILDDGFFQAYDNKTDPLHDHAQKVYWRAIERMLRSGEPGFSVDVGSNAGEHLRNAPVAAWTNVLTKNGYKQVGDIIGQPVSVWTGQQFAHDVIFKETNSNSSLLKIILTGGRVIHCSPDHPFMVGKQRVSARDLNPGMAIDVSMPMQGETDFNPLSYTLGWLYGDGSFGKYGADLTLCSPESIECWPWIAGERSVTLEDSRGFMRLYFDSSWSAQRSKNKLPQKEITPSLIAGLFDADGNWESKQKRIRLSSKHNEFLQDVRRGLETFGIMSHVTKSGHSTYGKKQTYQLVIAASSMHRFASIIPTKRLKIELDNYVPYRASKIKVVSVEPGGSAPVYCADVGVPEHSFMAEGVILGNCTELTSADDNDICNLGSLNLARIESREEFAVLVELATVFLLCGTLYSTLPYPEVHRTRDKNRRLGLGLMGIYEWLVTRGKPYAPDKELEEWLKVYETSTPLAAQYASLLGVSAPVKTRAIAPTGTIGILAETTTGIEPMFGTAYKRRYRKGETWHYQYVIEPLAKKLYEQGIDPDELDTAYDLANNPVRRLEFQAWVQQFVDHGISSTINLPNYDSQSFSPRFFGERLMDYLPKLRGITCYPDGAISGQVLNVVSFKEAIDWEGYEYEEVGNGRACVNGVCGV